MYSIPLRRLPLSKTDLGAVAQPQVKVYLLDLLLTLTRKYTSKIKGVIKKNTILLAEWLIHNVFDLFLSSSLSHVKVEV